MCDICLAYDLFLTSEVISRLHSPCRSNLQLVQWANVIIDSQRMNLRLGTVRGDSLGALEADKKILLAEHLDREDTLSGSELLGFSSLLDISSRTLLDCYYAIDSKNV
jgi:hypothetical protein